MKPVTFFPRLSFDYNLYVLCYAVSWRVVPSTTIKPKHMQMNLTGALNLIILMDAQLGTDGWIINAMVNVKLVAEIRPLSTAKQTTCITISGNCNIVVTYFFV